MAGLKGFDVGLSCRNSAQELLKLAKVADGLGFDRLWLAESYHYRGCASLAAYLASSTQRLGVGFGLVSPYTRHPALLAMELSTLHELAPGRIALTLGAARSAMVRHGLSLSGAKPARAIADALKILKGLLEGRRVSHPNGIIKIPQPGIALDAPPKGKIPLYVGGAGPLILRVGGELADGVLLMGMSGPSYIDYAKEQIERGAKKAGRELGEVELAAYLIVSVDRDGREAVRAIKPTLAYYIPRVADVMLRCAGLEDRRIEELRRALGEVKEGEGPELIDEELVDRLGVAGDVERVAQGMAEYIRKGLERPVAYEVLGPDRALALKLLIEEVKPRLEAELRR